MVAEKKFENNRTSLIIDRLNMALGKGGFDVSIRAERIKKIAQKVLRIEDAINNYLTQLAGDKGEDIAALKEMGWTDPPLPSKCKEGDLFLTFWEMSDFTGKKKEERKPGLGLSIITSIADKEKVILFKSIPLINTSLQNDKVVFQPTMGEIGLFGEYYGHRLAFPRFMKV